MIPATLPCRRRIHRFARTALAFSLLGSAALPLAAARPEPILLSNSGEARLELPTGEQVTVRLPRGAALDVTASLDHPGNGWLAAGTQPAGGPASARDLLLLSGQGPSVAALPSPPERHGALRQEPLPLVEDGRLAGLVWLEGDDRRSFGVRFAAWTGAAWDSPEAVAPPGPGSQLALTAARLADGSWLLAWSAFDGEDDEIVWSRRVNGTWSRPQRVTADNGVPDITPALMADGQTALLAWSRYEPAAGDAGGYRVVVSRFSGGRWTAPAAAAPAGSLYPTFEPSPTGTIRLLYRTAVPQGWEVLEMDADGRAIRRAAVTAAQSARPIVETTETETIFFRWPAAGTERSASWQQGERKP